MSKRTTVALIYDFDGTLSAGNMQEYDFIPSVGKNIQEFWDESTQLAKENDADQILAYMYKMLYESKRAGFSLRRQAFVDYGKKITLFKGVKEWFGRINKLGAERGLEIKHYINSSGMKEMIEGTPIAHEFHKIYACSFLYDVDGVAYWPAVAVNYTNKTQFIFKINKGVESVFDNKEVNKFIPENERPVQFKHMIYFGDGTTDIPSMRLVKAQGGHSVAVYKPGSEEEKDNCDKLVRDNRVDYVCEADYSEGGMIDSVVRAILDKIEVDLKLAQLQVEPQCGQCK